MATFINQTLALFLDAYRDLNARKMFWFALILSLLVVVFMAGIGFNEDGFNYYGWQPEIAQTDTSELDASVFYKEQFLKYGMIWLTIGATILALISTSTIFPEFLSAGHVDLMVSKPISRVRLFLTKYVAGLTFVALQVLVFTVAAFVAIGVRGGVWEPGLFLAVPFVVLFFSYLFGVQVLLGVLTRSSIAAFLLTMVLWFLVALVNRGDDTMRNIQAAFEVDLKQTEEQIKLYDEATPEERAFLEMILRQALEQQLERDQLKELPEDLPIREAFVERKTDLEQTIGGFEKWRGYVYLAKTPLPKTDETMDLLRRQLIDVADLPDPDAVKLDVEDADLPDPDDRAAREAFIMEQQRKMNEQTFREMARTNEEMIRERPAWWIVGTSLMFEGVCVGLACLMFFRRDF